MDSKTLESRQRWTLSQKIDHTLGTIDTFVSFREAMRKALQVNGRFFPDEEPANLFSIL